ncbi:MAG: methylmalonyl-CoA mutase family protein [Bacteroidales bacterium]|nr:methylmalonyl-CoA mutase family protein [Bacteroidales bacterium]MDD2425409.1 methylmalonyl-CoA mutase family protein [Bacteroidales bacterium]MDD3988809.1 methylmalonyl-CoA mutase family protein [Bacteroidales bacterium]
MAEKLFAEFPPVSTQQWEEAITKDLKGADYNKKLLWKSLEGFNVRPYYRSEDLKELKHLENIPGEFPYTRGTLPGNDWQISQSYKAGDDLKGSNAAALDGIRKGVKSVYFVTGNKKGFSVKEMEQLLEGIDLTATEVSFRGCSCSCHENVTSFIAYIKSKDLNPNEVFASFDFDPLAELTTTGNYGCSDYYSLLKKTVEAVSGYPGIRVIGVNGYTFNDAGGSSVQELGFALSMGSEYMALLTEAGFSPDEAARRIKFTFSTGSNYFIEIAKFRAARLLWANITREYQVKGVSACKMKIHAVTSGWNQTVYDSYVNMLRGTTEAMSASLAGVDSLEVLPFDFCLREPGEFSNRIARNIQIILKEESHFDKITDPAAGSYYIENLTELICRESWELFRAVEEQGGYRKAFVNGFVKQKIKESAAKRDANIATRREILLGTNQYPNFNEKADKDLTLDIVTRGGDIQTGEEMIAEPLERYRGAQPFEAIRFATETSGKEPNAFMLTFGNLAMCRARAQFSSNFFAVAGIGIIDNNRFSSVEEGVLAALETKAEIVVACSSDEEYAEALPKIKKMVGDKAIVVVAGEPACKEELIAAGVTNFISVKSNLLETLKEYQVKLGIL